MLRPGQPARIVSPQLGVLREEKPKISSVYSENSRDEGSASRYARLTGLITGTNRLNDISQEGLMASVDVPRGH